MQVSGVSLGSRVLMAENGVHSYTDRRGSGQQGSSWGGKFLGEGLRVWKASLLFTPVLHLWALL